MTDAEKLAEARDALHKLMTGQQEVEITTDEGTVKYAKTDQDKLERYVASLARTTGGSRPRAIPVSF
ncbi:gpW family head-tail joining protein [Hyphobacterium sp.]|uniref:gpW family head-tail joining protein n=1 Tax=Hyphobacterium sp. TaxID=2004662 RepID=UPI003BAC35E6